MKRLTTHRTKRLLAIAPDVFPKGTDFKIIYEKLKNGRYVLELWGGWYVPFLRTGAHPSIHSALDDIQSSMAALLHRKTKDALESLARLGGLLTSKDGSCH